MLEDKEEDQPLLSRMCERGTNASLLFHVGMTLRLLTLADALLSCRLNILSGSWVVPTTGDLCQRSKRPSGALLYGCHHALQSVPLPHQVRLAAPVATCPDVDQHDLTALPLTQNFAIVGSVRLHPRRAHCLPRQKQTRVARSCGRQRKRRLHGQATH
jgi:hypothetical protein